MLKFNCQADIDLLIRQNEQVWEEFYNRYKPKIKVWVMNSSNKSSEVEQEDLVAEIITKIWQRIDSFDISKAAMVTWIYKITKNHCIDHWRKASLKYVDIENFEGVDNSNYFNDLNFYSLREVLEEVATEDELKLMYALFYGYNIPDLAKLWNVREGTLYARRYSLQAKLKKS